MPRFKFYVEKAKFLATFIWWRKWELVRDEWGMTYQEMLNARVRLPEIERGALGRLRKAVEEYGGDLEHIRKIISEDKEGPV